MKTMRTLLNIIFAAGILAIPACCATPRGEVAREWTLMMREQQIAPIFPPREDIRIGDVYLTRGNPNDPKNLVDPATGRDFLEIPLLFFRTNLESSLITDYSNRPPYPLTPGSILLPVVKTETNLVTRTNVTITAVASTNFITTIVISNSVITTNIVNVPTTNSMTTTKLETTNNVSTVTNLVATPTGEEPLNTNIFSSTRPDRLRHVGFPEFSFAKVSTGSLQGVVPVEGLNVAFAGTFANANEGYVKISSGESVSLTIKEVLDAVKAGICTSNQSNQLNTGWGDIVDTLAKSKADNGSLNRGTNFYLTLVSEVFYARTIDVSFTLKKSTGGGVNVAGSPSSNLPSLAANAADRVKALNTLNSELLAKSTPGGSVTFASASDFGIGLRRTYTRPMAVGYRGVVIELKPCCGKWLIGSMSVAEGYIPMIDKPAQTLSSPRASVR